MTQRKQAHLVRALAALCAAAALTLTGCGKADDTEKAEPTPDTSDSKFKGNDYHSTALRARERAVKRMDEADKLRKEQAAEAAEFETPKKPRTPR